jgi:hypothetical protein
VHRVVVAQRVDDQAPCGAVVVDHEGGGERHADSSAPVGRGDAAVRRGGGREWVRAPG